jgi:hypothetical protein
MHKYIVSNKKAKRELLLRSIRVSSIREAVSSPFLRASGRTRGSLAPLSLPALPDFSADSDPESPLLQVIRRGTRVFLFHPSLSLSVPPIG